MASKEGERFVLGGKGRGLGKKGRSFFFVGGVAIILIFFWGALCYVFVFLFFLVLFVYVKGPMEGN